MRTAFIQALCDVAARDERIWLLTGDLGFSVLEKFAAQFPRRFVNVGVAEQNLTGVAAGLALSGKVVFTYSIANFPTLRCLEQVRNDVCYHRANVKIVAVGGGFTYGSHGYTHHGVEDFGILSTLPELVILAPGDPIEADLVTRAAAGWDGPCYIRLGKAGEPAVHTQPPTFAIGQALTVRDGRDVTLVSTGGMLKVAVDAADSLRGQGVQARVLSMPTLKPLDRQAVLRAAAETGGIVTVEEHRIHGGLGFAVADILAEGAGPKVPFRKLAVPDRIWHVAGSQADFRRMIGDPVAVVLSLLGRAGERGVSRSEASHE